MERQEFRRFVGMRQSCFEELKLDVAEGLKEVTFSVNDIPFLKSAG